MTRVMVTGHRKLGGGVHVVRAQLTRVLEGLKVRHPGMVAVSGMAWGTDLLFAECALSLEIPLVAAVPLERQAEGWPAETRRSWEQCLSAAHEVVEVWKVPGYEGRTPAARLMMRNLWMLDHSDLLIAVWDGRRSGGTWHTLEAARARGRRALVIDPRSGSMRVETT